MQSRLLCSEPLAREPKCQEAVSHETKPVNQVSLSQGSSFVSQHWVFNNISILGKAPLSSKKTKTKNRVTKKSPLSSFILPWTLGFNWRITVLCVTLSMSIADDFAKRKWEGSLVLYFQTGHRLGDPEQVTQPLRVSFFSFVKWE